MARWRDCSVGWTNWMQARVKQLELSVAGEWLDFYGCSSLRAIWDALNICRVCLQTYIWFSKNLKVHLPIRTMDSGTPANRIRNEASKSTESMSGVCLLLLAAEKWLVGWLLVVLVVIDFYVWATIDSSILHQLRLIVPSRMNVPPTEWWFSPCGLIQPDNRTQETYCVRSDKPSCEWPWKEQKKNFLFWILRLITQHNRPGVSVFKLTRVSTFALAFLVCTLLTVNYEHICTNGPTGKSFPFDRDRFHSSAEQLQLMCFAILPRIGLFESRCEGFMLGPCNLQIGVPWLG